MFEPRNFMNVVAHVLGSPDCGGQEFTRTVVGRAYYSAHLVAREYLLGTQRISRNKKGRVGHGPVIRALDKGKTEVLASALDQLMAMRGTADYDLAAEVPSEMAQQAKQLADLVLTRLARNGVPPPATPSPAPTAPQ